MTNPRPAIICPTTITELVQRFDDHRETYKNQAYNETQTRREFIDPFFAALGWDVDNHQGYAEAYKEVIHEDAIKVGGATKAPDYCFRIGGTRKFFVEAKKPSIEIKGDPGPAYQLRRYAWSNKLPLSILTDFEEFAVYDGRIRPDKNDKSSKARVLYCTYDQYAEKWPEIASIFAKDSILKGSFDKYAESNKKKRGTAEVDTAFLSEIEQWRDALARNINLRNPGLSVRDLNYAVTKTIDRIIFLRMCEDRGVETYAQLRILLNGTSVYKRLVELFARADERYNSGLFHFSPEKRRTESPDELTPNLAIDDKPLKDILKRLYYPDSPYEFSVLPTEILGQVYEQFLGNVITVKGRRVHVEPKPEVKKAGGVYYTPTYIVDYIVKHTVGKLLEDKTPNDAGPPLVQQKRRASSTRRPKTAKPIRVLDPACGSGSFLLGAYQYLLDWHLDYYINNDPESLLKKSNPPIYLAPSRMGSTPQQCGTGFQPVDQKPGAPYRLTINERKRILLNNIYGVDIDATAVETTKLSLLLKVLEGETQQSLDNQILLFHERALPDLAANIKCGNSLIGPEFYDNQQLPLLDDEERYRINVFDWHAEFPDVFDNKTPGFHAVIGNPPWGGDIDHEIEYFHAHFPDATKEHTDSFKLLVARSTELVGPTGYLSMIVPSALIRQHRYRDIRDVLLRGVLVDVVDLGENVFANVVAPSCIFVCQPRRAARADDEWSAVDARIGDEYERAIRLRSPGNACRRVSRAGVLSDPDHALAPSGVLALLADNCVRLGELEELKCKDAGINYQRVGVGMEVKGKSDLGQRLLYEGSREHKAHEMFWKGADINRFWSMETTDRFCRVECVRSLRENEVVRLARDVYALTPKLLLRQTADRPLATLDDRGLWFGRSVLAILPTNALRHNLCYFLGLLNSRYATYLYREISSEKGRVFAQVKFAKLKQLPVRIVDWVDPDDKLRHDLMVQLVQQMLDLHTQLTAAKTPTDKTAIQRQIDATDRRIDQLVYQLYDLTPEEIRIVEEASQ